MDIISTLKHCVPRPLRPPLRKCAYALFPSLRYAVRVQKEIQTYTDIENVHDLPPIAHYWSEKYLVPMLEPFGFRNSIEFFRIYIAQMCKARPDETIWVLSIGAGNCASEINIAEWLRENSIENYAFECVDINPEVLKRAQTAAAEKGFAERFTLRTFGLFESQLHERIGALPDNWPGASLAYLPSWFGVDLRVTVVGANATVVRESAERAYHELAKRVGGVIYAEGTTGMEEAVSEALLRVFTDQALCDRLVARGRERLALFNWHTSAAHLVDAFHAMPCLLKQFQTNPWEKYYWRA